mgnify:CR=1 FL=1
MSDLIAFVGVGNMGNPMAQNLVKAGKKVKVFDVSISMLEKAKENKLEVAKNLDSLITNEVNSPGSKPIARPPIFSLCLGSNVNRDFRDSRPSEEFWAYKRSAVAG